MNHSSNIEPTNPHLFWQLKKGQKKFLRREYNLSSHALEDKFY